MCIFVYFSSILADLGCFVVICADLDKLGLIIVILSILGCLLCGYLVVWAILVPLWTNLCRIGQCLAVWTNMGLFWVYLGTFSNFGLICAVLW